MHDQITTRIQSVLEAALLGGIIAITPEGNNRYRVTFDGNISQAVGNIMSSYRTPFGLSSVGSDFVIIRVPDNFMPAETPRIPDDSIGATVIFEDSGVWGYAPRQRLTGIIESVKDSRYHGRYFVVAVPGFNLPKVITESQIVAFTHPSLTLNATETAEAVSA